MASDTALVESNSADRGGGVFTTGAVLTMNGAQYLANG